MGIFLEAKSLTKSFGELVANDRVNLRVEEGTIHAVIGENGAGKSTLMKSLYGMLSPDSGEILVKNKSVKFHSPQDALKAGIGMVHQHFMLVERMSVLENLILGSEPMKAGIFVDEESALKSLNKLMTEAHTKLAPKTWVRDLSVGQQQRLEILKLLFRKSDCLIFDEPTGVLTPQEVDQFLSNLRELKARGKTILLITHKLHEVMAVADEITVMRGGESVATRKKSETTSKELAKLLVGHEVRPLDERTRPRSLRTKEPKPILEVENLFAGKLKDLSLKIYPGEILGVAGIEGNGQRDLVEVLWGLREIYSGSIRLGETPIHKLSVEKRKRLGLACIPEDRHRDGLILDFDLIENFYLGSKIHFSSRKLWPKKRVEEEVEKAIRQFEIKATGPRAIARSLSGGNQQKIIVARELFGSPKLLIAAQPTRGVDIGAIEKIHDELVRRRESGMGILLISSELDELLSLSHRIIVMREGAISEHLEDVSGDWTQLRYQIGEAMVRTA